MLYTCYSKKDMKGLLKVENTYKEFDSGEMEKFEKNKVIVLEKMKGVDIKLAYDGEKIKFSSKYKNNEEILHLINTRLIEKYRKIIKDLKHSSFVLFGKYLNSEDIKYYGFNKSEIVFNDIYVNNNWICDDHLEKLITKNNLYYNPKIYSGEFNYKSINMLANGNSIFSLIKNKPIQGVIIKNYFEDCDRNDRLCRMVTNKMFVFKKVDEKEIDKSAFYILKSYISGKIINKWKKLLEINKIFIVKTNISIIMKIISNEILKDLKNRICSVSKFRKMDERILSKKIKKLIPTLIRNNLKI